MSLVRLNQSQKRVEISKLEIENEIVFEFFNKLPMEVRDEKFFQALYIGCLALIEDRLSAFLSKTSNELGTQLESLKILFDLKKEIFFKSTIKGVLAEGEIAEVLSTYLKKRGLQDSVSLIGDVEGDLRKNKTGDILIECSDILAGKKIGIECKFDKSVKLGSIDSKQITANKYDTAWGQLLETNANRSTDISIIVFDRSLVDSSVEKFAESVRFVPKVGFICIVDSQKADYLNLFIAYDLARDILAYTKESKFDPALLAIIIRKIVRDTTSLLNVKKLVDLNIQTSRDILIELDKGLLSLEFNKKYLEHFLHTGDLSKEDLFDFYNEEKVREKFKQIKDDIMMV